MAGAVRSEAPDCSQQLYPEPRARRRAVASWCLFDFANSSYTTLIITVAFSVYFQEAVVNAADNTGDRLWGLANFMAMAVVALTSPVMGALADYSGSKKFLLLVTTLQTVVATALLFFVGPGHVAWAMALYVIATIGFEGGYVFYNSFLPEISTPATIGRVSGWAWGVGYIGGLSALGLCYPLIASELRNPTGELIGDAVRDRQIAFVVVAVFYFLFALPAFRWLREAPAQGRVDRATDYAVVGFRRVARTLRHLRTYRETGKFVLASLFFNDGITTIIIFSSVFATRTFHFDSAELGVLFLVLNVVAFPGALLSGYLADAIGAKRTLVLSLLLWIAVVLTGYLAQSRAMFWLMASGAAIGMGSTQAVSRSFMAQISPPEREAEFFGFYVLSGKFASIFGPLLFGLISSYTGSQRLAVLSILPLFVLGLVLMLLVDPEKARRAAQAPSLEEQ